MRPPYARILPGIKEIHWLGFRGRVDDLYHAGWQFAEERIADTHYGRERHMIAIRHPVARMEGVGWFGVDEEFLHHQHRMREYANKYWGPPVVPIKMEVMARRVEVATHGLADLYLADPRMHPTERHIPQVERYYGLRDLQVFREMDLRQAKEEREPQIILESATITDVLNFALEKQKPMQDELRRKAVQEARVAAQILKVA